MAPEQVLAPARTAADVAAQDAAIPALADVLDLDALTARLAAATGGPGQVSRPYLRHKPGTSCVLSCRWTPAGGAPRDLLVRAYAGHARSKLGKGLDPRRPGEVVLLDLDAGLVVTEWTADRQLPAAHDVAALAARVVGGGASGIVGGGGTVRLLRHNPERRAVLHVAGPDGEAVVRLVRPSAAAGAAAGYALLGAVADAVSRTTAHPVRVPRLRALDAERGVVVTDWVPGDALDRLDVEGRLDRDTLREVGALVAALHGARPVPGAGATEGADGVPERPAGTVPVHGDLSLDQVVRAPAGELWLVDGDAARWGRASEDLGSLAAALVRAHGDPDVAASRLAAVLDGYAGAGAAPVPGAELRRATAEHLRRRATEPFRRLERGWAATAAALTMLADDVDAGRGGVLGGVLDDARRDVAGAAPDDPRDDVARGAARRTRGDVPRIRTAPVALALADRLASEGRTLRAVLPRSAHRLLVVGTDRDGAVLAGCWDVGPDVGPAVATRSVRRAAGRPGGLVLQAGGDDPDLPGLAARVRDGATLVAHRSGRRGVVRDPAGSYTKVTRPGREPVAVTVPEDAFVTPAVLARGDGYVTTAALPGRTLHDLLRDPDVPDCRVADAGRVIGLGLRRMQHAPPPRGLVHDGGAHEVRAHEVRAHEVRAHEVRAHDIEAEVAVVARWWGLAVAHDAATDGAAHDVVAHVRARLAGLPSRDAVLTHRDLHDKQLLVDLDTAPDPGAAGAAAVAARSRAGLLDLDLAAVAHPALDLANLLVHLELRVHQGVCPAERAAGVARAVLDGYVHDASPDENDPDEIDPHALDAYPLDTDALDAWAAAARARLAAVYAFRPAARGTPDVVPAALLADLDRPLTALLTPLLTPLEDR